MSGRADLWPDIAPPGRVARHDTRRIVHEVALDDEFAWLRADNWREVLRDPATLPAEIRAVLDAENAYAAACLDALQPVVETLKREMRARIKEDDATVPLPDDAFAYYARWRTGGQHPVFCRTRGADGPETILVDGDLEAAGHAFFSIAAVAHAPDHERIAWSADRSGSELFEIRVREITAGTETAGHVADTDGSIVWTSDSQAFYYVRVDENHRTCRVYRHRLDRTDDTLVFEENDPAWFVGIDRAVSGAFAIIRVSDHDAAECHLLDLADPDAVPVCVEPRRPKVIYDVAHRGDTLFLRTNTDGADDFKIVSTPVAAPGRANWREMIAHRAGRTILAVSIFPDHLVRLEREEGLPRIVVRELASGDEHAIAFAEDAYALNLERRLAFETSVLRFSYASMTTPREIYDYDLTTRERRLRKRQQIPSGHDPSRYVTRRIFAEAADGARVPVSLLHRADLRRDGSAPLLLYGYGAYGHAIPAGFSANALSLVDRGFVYAIAHIRGGTDRGWHWYLDGKLDKKTNTFTDFLAAARALVAARFTGAGRIVAQGGSAGGLLMGAVANMAPDLFAGILAAVPFVDVLNTILDADLPLTPPEWLEWGNPIEDAAAFARIRSYSPYDNVAAQAYPPILALAGLTDPRVTYWEPAKWVARLRATMTGGGPVLLKTNMGAGHGGAPGRFDRLGEIAEQYAFALACVGAVVPVRSR